jgi:hypothetical protein
VIHEERDGEETWNKMNEEKQIEKANKMRDCVISQAASCQARDRSQFKSCGICGGQSGTGEGFLRGLWFPLPIFIPPNAPILRGWNNRAVSPPPTPRNGNKMETNKKTKEKIKKLK